MNEQEQTLQKRAFWWDDWKFFLTIITHLLAIGYFYGTITTQLEASVHNTEEFKSYSKEVFTELKAAISELRVSIKEDRYTASEAKKDWTIQFGINDRVRDRLDSLQKLK